MVDRLERNCSAVVVERRSPVEIVAHMSVGSSECRIERIGCCFRKRIGMMVGKQIGKCFESECIVEYKMVDRQMDRMVEHLGLLRRAVAVVHRKIHSSEDKLEHIEHLSCKRIDRMVDRRQHKWFVVGHIVEYIVAYRTKHKSLKMKYLVGRRRFELAVAQHMMRSTSADKPERMLVEHSLVDKLAYRMMCIVAVVVELRQFEPVVARHTKKNTSVDKLEHKQLEHRMADRMACMMKHTDFVGFVERQQLVADCCYSYFQNIHWYKMRDKLAYMTGRIVVVVVVERR